MRLRLPRYVHGFTDRHGKARYYFRRNGKRTPLPGLPHSAEFMAAYAAAKEGRAPERADVGASRTIPGTINALTVAYFNSAAFQSLSPSTRATYRGIIEGFRAQYGERSAIALDRRALAAIIGRKAETPAAAGNLLRMIRLLMNFAIANGWRDDDPTRGIKGPKQRAGGFHTWTEEEIAQFETAHPLGTRARLAFALLLWTGQRRGDVVRMGRQHVKGEVLTLCQQKTGATVQIPLHSDLRSAINALPNDNLTFLVTEYGKPFTAAGFGGAFRAYCDAAGLPKECAAHGLRKAAARRLAEAGCTAHEIMSITGHRTLREVTRYTDAADRRGLARDAMSKLGKGTTSGKP